ncbi:MAG: carbamoyl-phosphate synthase large subunit [Deltaproteobacteria bacterium]|nr:carbamoyl-phosphate synthase large subunit [Deltaproteobacteria bacterium]
MPRRTDIKTIFVIGSGPIVIGQACEFDYAGTQAVKALRADGFRIVLLNSNPATIMTDPEFADATYIEPITPEVAEAIIAKERPDALLPTLGGQTALNLALALHENGALARHGVKLIGASVEAIHKAESREAFKEAMTRIGLDVPKSRTVRNLSEARAALDEVGVPAIIRPSFTLGGSGGSIAYTREEYEGRVEWALRQSPRGEALIEESVLGWKEYELEVMRDGAGNGVIICSIENLDPMGVHTGDSITVAPAQTLTDKEYQVMRDAALAVLREIGVDTGGSNIQFAVHPETGRMIVIEMNPRVSRSSALASKATGFPIAKIAALVAVGYRLDEIPNDITRVTPASFEPSIDYVVTKIPRFAFEKFPGGDATLGVQMKSVGEAMGIGSTFVESLRKAVRSLETGRTQLTGDTTPRDVVMARVGKPHAGRLFDVARALELGVDIEELYAATKIDRWFLRQLRDAVEEEGKEKCNHRDTEKQRSEGEEKSDRKKDLGAEADVAFRRVDTCAAEFEAQTPYLYSTRARGAVCEARPTDRKKVVILGGGPNRIGQGIEFDYCCVQAVFGFRDIGYETIMVNCNPETVSTDYDVSDRLYFEPLTEPDVLAIVRREKPEGVVVQLGGQTPLKLAVPLERAGVRILGTSPDAIDRAEDRERFAALITSLGLMQPESGIARTVDEAASVAARLGFPLLLRPSYVLGGRAMQVVYDTDAFRAAIREAFEASRGHPVLVDRFLNDATEVDVDALADGDSVVLAGVLEHIEEAGVHSGDSAMVLPPFSLTPEVLTAIERATVSLGRALGVRGLMNIQFAVKDNVVYVLEVNPRASRTVPFVSKATGLPIARIAAKLMVGTTLAELEIRHVPRPRYTFVKESVFPFSKFPGTDTVLGPEMKSTGEVMGVDSDVHQAFGKAQAAAGNAIPAHGTFFISVKADDKAAACDLALRLHYLGFTLIATDGTCAAIRGAGVPCQRVNKVADGSPHVVDRIRAGWIQGVINTTIGRQSLIDSHSIRQTTVAHGVPYFTTIAAARAAVGAIEGTREKRLVVRALQEIHREQASH